MCISDLKSYPFTVCAGNLKTTCACPCVDQILTQFPILFDVVFPKLFQDWLDALAIISLDLYTFVGIHCAAQGSSSALSLVVHLCLL